jgi:hypothetical protein
MKKTLLTFLFTMLFSATYLNAQVTRTWVFPSPVTTAVLGSTPFVSPGTAFLDTTVVDGLTLVPGTGITTFGVTAGSNVTFAADATVFTGNFKFGGAGFASTVTAAEMLSPTANFMPTQRYVSFPVAAGTTSVKVWFKTSSGGALRSLVCTDGVAWKTFVTTTTDAANQAIADQGILNASYTGGAGTLYLFSEAGANLYKIVVNGPALGLNNFELNAVNVFSNGKQINVLNVTSETQVNVYNMTGALVKSFATSSDTNFELLNSGLYIVNVNSAEGQKSVKVIVK